MRSKIIKKVLKETTRETKEKVNNYVDELLNTFRPKSPCHNEPMKSVDCHDNFGDMPIYQCPKCKTKWI